MINLNFIIYYQIFIHIINNYPIYTKMYYSIKDHFLFIILISNLINCLFISYIFPLIIISYLLVSLF